MSSLAFSAPSGPASPASRFLQADVRGGANGYRRGVGLVARSQAGPQQGSGQRGAEADDEVELSTMKKTTVNIVKNLLGAGMLSLPAGIAAFTGSSQALMPAILLTLILGLMSAYGFIMIADACERTGESTYQGAWAKSISQSTSWIPLSACLAKAGLGCVAFSMILGDCLPLILRPLGLPAALTSRSGSILAITAIVLLPLCRMKSLAPLAKFSMLGVLSNVYICCFIILRAIDGSYRFGGAFFHSAPVYPQFSAPSGVLSTLQDPKVMVLISMLSTAFLAHYNGPLYYQQLAPAADGSKNRRFALASVLSFMGAVVVFSTVMVGGFLTFGSNCSGLILNNYSAEDSLAFLARVAIALSLVTSYPLVFASVRQQFVALLGKRGEDFDAKRPDAFTAMLIGLVTLLAVNLTNLGKLVAVGGALFGNFLIYMAPAMMVLSTQFRNIGPCSHRVPGRLGQACQMGMIPLGLLLGFIGMTQSLK